jgi:flagellar protein FlbD
VIELHRLGSHAEDFLLNPDLVSVIEAHPDTVITLTTGVKILVAEAPQQVTALIRAWRAAILREALGPHPLRVV